MGLGYRELVRLKMSPNDVNNFVPPKGLDITWHDYDYENNLVTASIIGSEFCPEDTYFVYKEEVNHLLTKLKVAQDGIRDSKYKINNFRSITTPVSYIENTENDNLISKGTVHKQIIDKQRLFELNKRSKIDNKYIDKNIYQIDLIDINI